MHGINSINLYGTETVIIPDCNIQCTWNIIKQTDFIIFSSKCHQFKELAIIASC